MVNKHIHLSPLRFTATQTPRLVFFSLLLLRLQYSSGVYIILIIPFTQLELVQGFQGMPGNMGGGPMGGPRGMRPDWNRPPMHGGGGQFQQGPMQGHPQGPPHMQQGGPGGPRGPPPQQMGVSDMRFHSNGQGVNSNHPHHQYPNNNQMMDGSSGPAPHVNPAFFNQGPGGGPQQHPNGPPQPNMGGHPQQPNQFNQMGPRGPWPGPMGGGGGGGPGIGGGGVKPPGAFPEQGGMVTPQISEVDFEEIMARNRTVSSSAIARAVSDAAAGEYSSAIETLVTAISLIKQSKVAQDERCKILISSLQDTLHGIEAKSYSRRERSRSRDRHRRPRRERSNSRYRDRSRERERERDRDG